MHGVGHCLTAVYSAWRYCAVNALMHTTSPPKANVIHKMLLALTLLACAVPRSLPAQAEWRVDAFTTTERGFRGTLMFRNGQSPLDTPIRGIGTLRITLTPDTPRCANFNACFFASNIITRVGNVDTRRLDFAGGATLLFSDEVWSEDSCIRCWQQLYTAPPGLGALGCAAPYGTAGGISYYAGRTCTADGFDGWFALPFEWVSYEAPPVGFVWKASDLVPQFTYRSWGNVNGFLVPEPASSALLAIGVVVLGVWGKRRWLTE